MKLPLKEVQMQLAVIVALKEVTGKGKPSSYGQNYIIFWTLPCICCFVAEIMDEAP
jgi:hypothetical protein